MVVSPGVRADSLPIKLAEAKKIPVITELELAYTMCPASTPIIAVTGTSGKTTTTTLIGQMLRSSGLDAIICGNIGNP
ncbi:MAG TPA: UDP-N-acetylmuramoyl-L-alanine--D-glutamate ligase, partial [Candidatus Omnitrophica bacterium]|nr:UDP-N-acetylmuramoyl-L-alanine--D-glutamate ligase [Candidatus Omnitrophota bacterium]